MASNVLIQISFITVHAPEKNGECIPVRITGRITLLSMISITLLAMATFVTPAAAVYVSVVEDEFVYQLAPDNNNHSYGYVEFDRLNYVSRHNIISDADLGIDTYAYQYSGWQDSFYGVPGDTETIWTWYGHNTLNQGPYGETAVLPVFYDFETNSGNPVNANITGSQRSVGLPVGQETSVVVEEGWTYYGAIGIGNEEFIHLQVGCRSELVSWDAWLYDPDGFYVGGISAAEGEVRLLPFRPAKTGTYVLAFYADSSSTGLIVMDFLPQAIAPAEIPLNGLVDGNLEGSEWTIQDGNVVYEEKVPTAHTYRFKSSEVGPAKLLYSMNIPDWYLPPFAPIQPSVSITGDAYYMNSADRDQMRETYTSFASSFGYQSFGDMSFYVTVMGGENYEYTLYNQDLAPSPLPVNESFYVENLMVSPYEHRVYGLHLEQDSLLKLNSSDYPIDVDWSFWTVDEDMALRSSDISYYDSFEGTSTYYLPAGDYVFQAYVGSGVAEHFRFAIGAIGQEPNVEVMAGGISGFRTSSSGFDYYNLTYAFMTQDNVTARGIVGVMDAFGSSIYSAVVTLGNIQDGDSWIAYGANESYTVQTSRTEADVIVYFSPTWVRNNTAGLENYYWDYAVTYQAHWDRATEEWFDEIKALTVGSSPGSVNFTLPEIGSLNEYYMLNLTAPVGIWWNVTVTVGEVDTWSVTIYQEFALKAQRLQNSDISDTASGSVTDVLTFQFGSISNEIMFYFDVDRAGNPEGFFHISIAPLNTTSYKGAEPLVGPAPSLGPALVYIGVGAGAVVIIVVLVILYKRKTG
ncbi:MAG: hypothetical protein EAX95_08540 [Candidatus Thorarchaeota archaeon]|nr:hypothetical protein [Candidatus Thorarchaeota archaeon]